MKLTIHFVSAAAIIVAYVSLSNANDDQGIDVAGGIVKATKADLQPHRRLQLKVNQRWKERNGDVIVVAYSTTRTTKPTDAALISRAVKDLGDRAKIVKFVTKTNQKAYIDFRTDGTGCNSDIGRILSGTVQILNLDANCMTIGIIQQTLLRALGMFYEQNRKDRNRFVAVNLTNVPDKNLNKFVIASESVDLGTPYDYESLMHYGSNEFSINPNIPVITATNGETIGQREGPSELDIIELRLMYQCISGPRTLSEYESNLCTSDCKCWEGAEGCDDDDDDDDDACIGDLRCVDNTCVNATGGATQGDGGCTDVPSNWVDSQGDSCQVYAETNGCATFGNDFANYGKTANEACCACGGGSNIGTFFINLKNKESPNLCIGVSGGSTIDGAAVIHSPCNGGTDQKWYWDSNNYIRSALDISKCIVGARGLSDPGTNLIINACFPNDNRFVWEYNPDFSIRPLNNNRQCVGPSLSEPLGDGVFVIQIFDCVNDPPQQWTGSQPTRRERVLQSVACTDDPPGWYNKFDDDCAWYSENTNCEDYGATLSNFNKTANQACCACGGGSTPSRSAVTFAAVDNMNNCWDTILDWVDSVGDACFWYSQGNNCDYYGNDFANPTTGGTAKEVCCACGGGSSSPSIDMSGGGTPGCSDSPSRWVDANNDGCDFYAIGDNCNKFGMNYANYGKTASEVCCACRKVSSPPTKSPTKSPCGLFNLSILCPFTLCGIFGRLFGFC